MVFFFLYRKYGRIVVIIGVVAVARVVDADLR